jgi:hypothetical protein
MSSTNERNGGQDGKSNAMTYYNVLNVSEKASAAAIKSTYRLLMKAFHPDHLPNSSDDLTRQHVELVKAINGAYFVLSNPSRRASYDAHLASERAAVYVPQLGELPSCGAGRRLGTRWAWVYCRCALNSILCGMTDHRRLGSRRTCALSCPRANGREAERLKTAPLPRRYP